MRRVPSGDAADLIVDGEAMNEGLKPPVTSGQPTYVSYKVWDAPTRWLHWIYVVAVLALAFTGFLMMYRHALLIEGPAAKLALKEFHAAIGYVLVTSLLARILWGFFGNRFSRWSAVLPGPRALAELGRDFRSIVERRRNDYLGRSPLSRLSATALFTLLIIQAGTGVVFAAIDLYHPPFGRMIQAYIAAPGIDPRTIRPGNEKTTVDKAKTWRLKRLKNISGQVHIWEAYAMIVFVVLHIAGVVLVDARKEGALISAMFTGRKLLAAEPLDADDRNDASR